MSQPPPRSAHTRIFNPPTPVIVNTPRPITEVPLEPVAGKDDRRERKKSKAQSAATTTTTPPGNSDYQTRKFEAQSAGESDFSGAFAHVVKDKHFDPRGYDQVLLTICLTTYLAYLYTRSWPIVLAGFVVWFLWECIVWLLVSVFSPAVKRHVVSVESRDTELFADWILFLTALAFSIFTLNFTLVGFLGVSEELLHTFPHGFWDWVAVVAIVLVSLLSAFPDIFYRSAVFLLATIWIVYFCYGNDLQLYNALNATVATLWFYAWFMWPIAYYYLYNAFFLLLSSTFILSLITGLATI
jgi:hypothetical protein